MLVAVVVAVMVELVKLELLALVGNQELMLLVVVILVIKAHKVKY